MFVDYFGDLVKMSDTILKTSSGSVRNYKVADGQFHRKENVCKTVLKGKAMTVMNQDVLS